jgi:hypothetical protein
MELPFRRFISDLRNIPCDCNIAGLQNKRIGTAPESAFLAQKFCGELKFNSENAWKTTA